MNPIIIIGPFSVEEQQRVLTEMDNLLVNYLQEDEGPNWDTACNKACVDIRRHNHTREICEDYNSSCYALEYRVLERISGIMRLKALKGDVKAASLVLGTKVQINTPVQRRKEESITTTTKVTLTQEVTKEERKQLKQYPDSTVADYLKTVQLPEIVDIPFEIIKPQEEEEE